MPRVIHFEIHAEDPERAVRFYQAVLGWQFHKWDGPAEYWLIKTLPEGAPGIDGGLLRRRGPGPVEGQAVNSFICTVDAPSVDESARLIEANGGKVVVPKMAVPGVGWLIYGKDTEGNIFGVMEADREAR
jgi:predicted enzyme related to lactoylglutathione lyase